MGIRTKPSPGGVRSLPQARSASGVEGEAKMVRLKVVGLEGTGGGVRFRCLEVVMVCFCLDGLTYFLGRMTWSWKFGGRE